MDAIENLVTAKLYPNTNWAFERLRSNGTPEPIHNKSLSRGGSLVSPSSEGLVNYPSQSFSPQTGLHYSNVVNSYSVFYWSGESFLGTFKNALRATDPGTGKVVWQHDYLEPYGIRTVSECADNGRRASVHRRHLGELRRVRRKDGEAQCDQSNCVSAAVVAAHETRLAGD